MGEVRPIPTLGGVVRDVRGGGRALRVSWHGQDGLVVLSMWDGARCTGTVRVAASDVPLLVEALQIGLVDPASPADRTAPAQPATPADPPAATPSAANPSATNPSATNPSATNPSATNPSAASGAPARLYQPGLDGISNGPEDGVAG